MICNSARCPLFCCCTGIICTVSRQTLLYIWEQGQLSWCNDCTTEWTTEDSFDSWQGQGIFLFSEASTPYSGTDTTSQVPVCGAFFPASQEILRVLRDTKLITLCTRSCQLFRFLAGSFQSTTFRPISFKVHFNIVLSSTPSSSKWSFLLRVSPP